MTWTAVGTNPALSLHNTGSASLTTHGVGNLIIMVNTDHSTTDFPSGVSSSRVTWTKAVPDQGPNTNGNISQSPTQWNGNVWFGLVNSVGSDTVTFSYTSGSTPSFTNAAAMEFTSPTGQWSLSTFAVLNSSSGTSTWPSVTPTANGSLVFGFAWNFGSAVSGSTSGYVYNSNADTAGNGSAYNLNCASGTPTAPVWGDSTETYGIIVAVSPQPLVSLIPNNQLNLNTQSLETDASDWSALTNSSVAQSSAHAFDGTESLAITSTASGAASAIINSGTVAFPAVTPGSAYQFYFYAYTTSSGISVSANGDFYNVSTFVSSFASPSVSLTPSTWTLVSVSGIAPPTSTLLRPIPQFTATAGGQVVYIDSVFFGPPATTFSAVGTAVYSNGTTISLDPATAGNFYILLSEADGTGTPAATGVSGGNCTWKQLGSVFTSTVTSAGYTAWLGTATAGGTSTATVTFNGSTSGGNMMAQQFTAANGVPALDGTLGTFSSATTVSSYPSRTPSVTADLYVGFGRDTGSPVAGSTSGYVYQIAGTHYGLAYNPACSGSAQSPAWGDSGVEEAISLLLQTVTYSGTGGQLSSPAQPGLAQPGAFVPSQVLFTLPLTVWNGQLTATATAHASFGGTRTALGHFTAAATAHDVTGGTRTTFGHLTTAVTAHMADAGTRTTFGTLTAAATAHMTAAGTRTTFGSLTTTATAHMTAAGTKTGLGSLTTAATAHMAAAGTKTALGHLTSAATAAATFTGGRTQFGTLTAAVTAHDVTGGTRTTFGSLTTAATAHMAAAGTKTALGHLTANATAAASFARTRITFGSLTAAIAAHDVTGGTKTALGVLAASATAHLTTTGTKTALGHLTTTATAVAAFAGTHTGSGNGVLTAAATAHGSFTGTKTGLGNLAAAATAHSAFTGTRTQFGHLTTAVTAHMASAGTKTALGHLIATATASAGFHAVRATTSSFTASVTAHLTASAVAFLAHQPRNLGGTVIQAVLDSGTDTLVPNPYGGTIAQANLGGGNTAITLGGAANTVANVLGGSISDPGLGGTLTSIPFGGGVTGWTMQNVNLNFAEFNDITLNVTITSNGSALNLTGYTVNMLLKPLAGVLDSDGRVLTLSSAGGSPAIVITNAGTGACTVSIPHSDLQDETHTFYRIDAVDGSGNINTAIYGNITYTSL